MTEHEEHNEHDEEDAVIQFMKALGEAIGDVADQLGLDKDAIGFVHAAVGVNPVTNEVVFLTPDDAPEEIRQDHATVQILHRSVMETMEKNKADYTDAEKLRQLAWKLFMRAINAGHCVHEAEVAWDLLPIADRLDLADISDGAT